MKRQDLPKRKELLTPKASIFLLALAALSAGIGLGAEAGGRTAVSGRPTKDSRWANGLVWRNIGPYRGGRATTAVGVPGNARLYYMGATGGGVWKSEDGGRKWRNISDGFFSTGSIGDIAVYSGDPRIIYVGTGEAPVRGQMSSYGDGVYRSDNAGETWRPIGLEKTRQISRIVVHPGNPDLVYVAAQGSRWGASEDRGVYRSRDGGSSWQRILFSSTNAGASDLAMDPRNPNVLYAAFWDFQRFPWAIRSGGPGSGVWKSVDGGDHWERLRTGLPETMGKIRIAVSPADSRRLYAGVEAERGGLYRSDDAGETWRLMSDDGAITTRPWYYLGVTADPRNADTVYVSQAALLKSVDGGARFSAIDTPHSDTHSLWINPDDPSNLINTDDGGTSVSFDGGRSWSPIDNQPTAQFYGAQTDDLFPYNVYGGQQDFGPVSVPSRGRGEFREYGGGESARFGFDPKNPRFLLVSNFLGALTLVDRESGLSRNAGIWPGQHLGLSAEQMPYRFCWSSPVAVSPFNPAIVYHGANVLLRSEDQGVTWTAISPDLTRNDASRHGRGGLFWHDGSGGEVYNAIYSIAESPLERGTIWVGTDDGLVQLTRDGGRTWNNVTPSDLDEGWILSVEASPHTASKAYAVFSRHRQNDQTPHIFRTADYGRTWTDLAGDLPPDHPARSVCEDPGREGLLFAATEYGVWMSLDDGVRWQSLQGNLPRVPISGLTVRESDLIAATEGRGFWIMDDFTPLRETGPEEDDAPLFLYSPRRTVRILGIGGYGDPEADEKGSGRPENPPDGAILHYSLARPLGGSDRLKLEIRDETGAVVRSFEAPAQNPPPPAGGTGAPGIPGPRIAGLPASAGLNRFVWDLRGESVPGVSGNGPRLPSGRFLVRMTLGETDVSRPLEVVSDPRTSNTSVTERGRYQLARKLMDLEAAFNRTLGELNDVRTRARELMKRAQASPSPKRDAAIRALIENLDAVHRRFWPFDLNKPIGPGDQRPMHYGLGSPGEIYVLRLTIESGWGPATQGERSAVAEIEADGNRLRVLWDRALADLDEVNALAVRSGLKPGISRPEKRRGCREPGAGRSGAATNY